MFVGLSRDEIAVLALQGAGSRLHFMLMVGRYCGEILIVLSALFIFAHRIIGFCLGYYIRSLLDPQNSGIFGFHFDWVSLRVGLDSNMLVLHGFEWRNPPEFTHTPYFIRIDEVGFQIDAASAYDAIMHGGSIRVHHIKLDRVELYIEKLNERSIKRAQENGLLKSPAEKAADITQAVEAGSNGTTARANRAESRTDQRPSTPVPMSSPAAPATAGAASTSTPAQPAPLKAGALNLWACMGGTEAATEKLDVLSTLKNMGNTITSTFRKTFGVRGRSKRSNSAGAGMQGSDNEQGYSDFEGDDDTQESESVEAALARLQAEYPDLVLPPLPTEAYDREDIQHYAEVQQQQTKETRKEARKRERDAWKGWGVPYLLEVDQLYVHDIRLHASDFLNARHTKDDKASAIKLKSFTMFREELTLSPDKKIGKNRRGIYLDDLVWRLVNKLVRELLIHNSVGILMILTSAVATNTTSLASSGTASSAKLFSNAAATTTSTARFALNAVGSVFNAATGATSSGNNNSSSSSSSVASTVGGGASSATQSAMQVLNNTSANVSEGARSVVNSINPFMRRTASTSK